MLMVLAIVLMAILLLSIRDCIWTPPYFPPGNGKWLLPLAVIGLLVWTFCLVTREAQIIQELHRASLGLEN
jgi:hypothetical protein